MAGESFGKNCGNGEGKVARERHRKVGLIYDETMCKHDTPNGEDHYECPDRIRVIWEKLQLAGVAQRCVVLGGSKAEDKHLQLVHTKKHVNLVKRISTKQRDSRRNKIASQLDSIYLNRGSSEAAYLAAGSVVEMAEKVAEGEVDCGFAIVRPPGHHAEVDEAMGFCLFNNVAVAASYLLNERPDLGVKKILIVDWDVHHGNGTQKMFWEDPRVLFFSVHRHDHGSFYPTGGDGDYNMVGEGPGEGFNINIPWEQGGCGDADYFAAWNHILIPVTTEFNPDIILLSAGFDAAIGDPLGGCCVTPYGYSVMLKKLMEFAQGKMVLALEGGYNLESMAKSSLACVQVLLEDKPIQCSPGAYPLESTWHVIQAVRNRLSTYWPSLTDDETIASRRESMKMAEVFRTLPNRFNITMPPLDKWRRSSRDIYINYAHNISKFSAQLDQLTSCFEEDSRSRVKELGEVKKVNVELAERIRVLEDDVASVKKKEEELSGKLSSAASRRSKDKEEITLLRGKLLDAETLMDAKIAEAVTKAKGEAARGSASRVRQVAKLLHRIGGTAKDDMLDLAEIDASLEFIERLRRPDGPNIDDAETLLLERKVPIYDARDVFSELVSDVRQALEIAEDDDDVV